MAYTMDGHSMSLKLNTHAISDDWISSLLEKNITLDTSKLEVDKFSTPETVVDIVYHDSNIVSNARRIANELITLACKTSPKSHKVYKKSSAEVYKLIRARKTEEALAKCNIALLNANHDKLELCYAFENRSAAFFEMNRFNDSLYDIEAAITCNYPPDELHHDILPRRIRCLAALNQTEQLHQELASINKLTSLFPKNTEYKSLASLTASLLAKLKKSSSNVIQEDKSYIKLCALFTEIELNENSLVENATAAVKIEFDYAKGRLLRSTHDIEIESDIVREEALVSILFDEHQATKCHNCLITVNERFIPCKNCTQARYCSFQCQQEHHLKHSQCCKYFELTKNWSLFSLVGQLLILKRNETSKQMDSYSRLPFINYLYSKWYGTAHARNFHGVSSLSPTLPLVKKHSLALAVEAYLMARCLQHLDKEAFADVKERDLVNEIFKLLLIIECCKIKFIERDQNSRIYSYGIGVFATYSLLNHSCDANCRFITFGNQVYVQSTKDILAGEELTINYGVNEGAIAERQKYLKENFGFICKCNLCS